MSKTKNDRGKGSTTVSKSSAEAKRIEDTHGFKQAQSDQDDRDKARATTADQADASDAAGE